MFFLRKLLKNDALCCFVSDQEVLSTSSEEEMGKAFSSLTMAVDDLDHWISSAASNSKLYCFHSMGIFALSFAQERCVFLLT